MDKNDKLWPELSMPEAEADVLREAYTEARVILEYGSGGSTTLAASMQGKRIFSVESDKEWALKLQTKIDQQDLPSPTTLYYVDIGPTGAWGRPLDTSQWHLFHAYPLAIWDEPYFLEPDVVLIDGRFRLACMMTALARATKPVTILCDDYLERPSYHAVERFIKPDRIVGRMAVFKAEPGLVTMDNLFQIVASFSMATYVGQSKPYEAEPPRALR